MKKVKRWKFCETTIAILVVVIVIRLSIYIHVKYKSRQKRLLVLNEFIDDNILVSTLINTADKYSSKKSIDLQTRDSIRTFISSLKTTNHNALSFRSDLLCVTFVKGDNESLDLLKRKLVKCNNWGLFVYGNTVNASLFDDFRSQLIFIKANINIVFFEYNISRYEVLLKYSKQNYTLDELLTIPYNKQIFPKPMMIALLSTALDRFKYVWIFDEDIHFDDNFDVQRLLRFIKCSFNNSQPLISQPLIYDNTQTYDFLNEVSWRDERFLDMTLYAAQTRFIEIQAPIFDSMYLKWYIENVLSEILLPAHILGADWGIDSLFCETARSYQNEWEISFHGHSTSSIGANPVCAVILHKNTSVRHFNVKSIDKSIGYPIRKALNHKLTSILINLFPNFYLRGLNDVTNPLVSGQLASNKIFRKNKLLISDKLYC